MPTREQYEAAFEIERAHEYPVIDEFEKRMGFAVDRERLEAAARVLACPVKRNPPNWQHGRVIYALGRNYLAQMVEPPYVAKQDDIQTWVDIGTAKGFSAVCMSWALDDAVATGGIQSWDTIDPNSRDPRNSIEDGKTVMEFVAPFRALDVAISFGRVPSVGGIVMAENDVAGAGEHIGFAFIDGSHTYEGVKADIAVVAPRQQTGDIILFDDVNKEQVNRAVREMQGYELEYIRLLPQRAYAIAVKK